MTFISQSEFLQALGWAVLNSLWQMALLWVIYQSVTALFPIKKSSNRSALATYLLFAGFAWFVFTFVLIISENTDSSGFATLMNVDRNAALNKWLEASLPIASLVYLLLLTLPVLNFIRNYRYVQMIRYYGISKANVEWRMFVQKLSARMGIHKHVQVWMSEFVHSPVTIGYLKPIILLPVAAVNHLTEQQIEAVLLHELSHIRRYDYFLNLLSRFIQAILYFNPFVKAFNRIIETEREKSCDEMVMQFQYEPHGYASALLTLEKVSELPSQSLAVAASGARRNQLLGRVETILGIRKKNVFSFNKLAGVMAALLCFIGLNALLIMARPSGTVEAAPGFLSQLSTPFLFMTEPGGPLPAMVNKENQTSPIVNDGTKEDELSTATLHTLNPTEEHAAKGENAEGYELSYPSNYTYVNFKEQVVPVLTPQQEAEVTIAMEKSRKVIEDIQWKTVENNIADVMNQQEKEYVKNVYDKAAKKANWEMMTDKMRLAYNDIDWKSLNAELNNAVAKIRLDSLQTAYSVALESLGEIKAELDKQGLKGIPDSDVTLKQLEVNINQLQQANEKLKSIRNRPIIKL